ncbi:MAG: hypothetical protein ACQEUB_12585 [Thermodesulfobacteriota bacterium]
MSSISLANLSDLVQILAQPVTDIQQRWCLGREMAQAFLGLLWFGG